MKRAKMRLTFRRQNNAFRAGHHLIKSGEREIFHGCFESVFDIAVTFYGFRL